MIEGILTVLSGGLTGLLGTIWSTYNQRKNKELDIKDREKARAHEVSMVKAESMAMVAEAEANIKVTNAKIAGEVEVAEVGAFTESLAANREPVFKSRFMDRLFEVRGFWQILAIPCGVLLAMFFGLADTVKSMARPGITAYLLGISTWITLKAWQLLEAVQAPGLTPTMAVGIVTDTINIVLYLTVTAVTWWFGDRMASKGLAKNLKLGRV
ncbi:hypothetical protein DSLASN_02330 [Desulfoluna limicola]|uniref:Uncharacterized protein n=1 Tax=Desulfoluna limicola TaxID=2810562 RepID=A0ABM7PBM3_9BACT|nr:hypothetical protein [Desulfoluna limicola]BCS94601.1 hypothetical protein DSLASN_02330 [Desulfoluna limicola]